MVKIKNLCLCYEQQREVLKDISFELKEGECILLTGTSGSGKSSIINTINGLATRYDSANSTGFVEVYNKSLTNLKLYEISMLISSVFQNPKTHFFNVNTTLELLFYLENIGLTRKQMDDRLEEMLQIFPIQHLLDRDIFKLSGGEKQILCVAACYISGTKIIVLDEPSSNLDEIYIDILSDMLSILKSKGITLIVAEHRIYYLMNVVDRIFFIQEGKISQEYTKEEFEELHSDYLNSIGIRSREKNLLTIPSLSRHGDLEINHLIFCFENDKLVLQNISFRKGKIYGIIGKNGCGKSTLVRSLIGVEKSCRDEIYFEGKKLSKRDRLKISSLVMQDVNHQLFTDSVESEVRLGVRDTDDEKIKDILRQLNIYDVKDRHPMSLSGGQKQRVAIASVIYKNSKLIFFDEPTSGMDYANMKNISTLLKGCSNENNIIFIVSHDIEFLNMTADEIINVEHYRSE